MNTQAPHEEPVTLSASETEDFEIFELDTMNKPTLQHDQ